MPTTPPPEQAAAPPAQATAPLGAVKVYAPKSGVKAARLLPMDPPVAWTKKCTSDLDGEVELSLLVDTSGMARNIMFLRPTGSAFDAIAIQLAVNDRFEPGTLDGKPVVVAQTLKMRVETCVSESKDDKNKIEFERTFRSPPKQSLGKPKNPPQEAVLAPLDAPTKEIKGKVTRPDYFSAVKSAPVLIYSADADYTPTKLNITGVCKVSLVVDAHGLPENVRVLKPLDPGLDKSALTAVEKYRFFPAIEDEQPVSAAIVVDVNFAPPEWE
jgi:TonB family protein